MIQKGCGISPTLQGTNRALEMVGDFVGGSVGWERDGRADVDCDFAKAGEAAMFALHLPDAVEAHGNNR